jgi:hypothetical protein
MSNENKASAHSKTTKQPRECRVADGSSAPINKTKADSYQQTMSQKAEVSAQVCWLISPVLLRPGHMTFATRFLLLCCSVPRLTFSLFITSTLASLQYSIRLIRMSMTYQPLASLIMQVAQRRTACDHHPHGILWISGLSRLPLFLSYKKILHLLHIACAQDRIQTLSEIRVICHIFPNPP